MAIKILNSDYLKQQYTEIKENIKSVIPFGKYIIGIGLIMLSSLPFSIGANEWRNMNVNSDNYKQFQHVRYEKYYKNEVESLTRLNQDAFDLFQKPRFGYVTIPFSIGAGLLTTGIFLLRQKSQVNFNVNLPGLEGRVQDSPVREVEEYLSSLEEIPELSESVEEEILSIYHPKYQEGIEDDEL